MTSTAELQDRLTRLENAISLSGDGILQPNLGGKATFTAPGTGEPIVLKIKSPSGGELCEVTVPVDASLDQLKEAVNKKLPHYVLERLSFTLGATTVVDGKLSASGVANRSELVFRDRGTLPQRLEDLKKAWGVLETPDFERFYERYARVRDILDLPVEMKDVQVLNDHKEALLLASFEDLKQTAHLHQSMEPLTQYIETNPIPGVNKVSSDLEKAEALSNARLAEVLATHSEVESFLDSYNTLINLMSQKLLMYNASLAEWENKKGISKK